MKKFIGLIKLTRPIILLTTSLLFITSSFLSINGVPQLYQFLGGFLSVSLAIAAAHVFNDYSDWKIDVKNPRTSKRPIPTGLISPFEALSFAALLGIIAIVLALFLNIFSFFIALLSIPLPFIYNFFRKYKIPFSLICTVTAVFFIILFGSTSITSQLMAGFVPYYLIFGLTWETGRTLISELQDVQTDKFSDISTFSVIISPYKAAKLIVFLFSISVIASLSIGFLANLGIMYFFIASSTGLWLIYKSIMLLKEPTSKNAIKMRINAPRYLVAISILMTTSIIVNPFI